MKPIKPGPIIVIGSINMDLVCQVPRMPRAGETIAGGAFGTIPGGKGANQAVAAARLGGDVHMIGRVGDDAFGENLLKGLKDNRVNVAGVKRTRGLASGVAMILVDGKGENSIVISPGANGRVTPADVDAAKPLLKRASVVVLQLEIPLATVLHAIDLCRGLGVFTILDPAPARPLPDRAYRVDVFTPNQTEAELLTGQKRPEDAANWLLRKGAKSVVLKRGNEGSIYVPTVGSAICSAPYKIKVVDTTAAGDSFTAALAVGFSERFDWPKTLAFANAAGALCCTKLGAQPSLPTRKAVQSLM